MKRALFDTVAVLPFTSGSVTERMGFESAILSLTIAAGKTATVKVEHADTEDGPFEAVSDTRLFVDNPVGEDGSALVENSAEAETVANLNIDLIGCKEFVKITATGGAIAALALGDATEHPVKAGEIAVTAGAAKPAGTGGKS